MARMWCVCAGIFLLLISDIDRTFCKKQFDFSHEDQDYDEETIKKVAYKEVQEGRLRGGDHGSFPRGAQDKPVAGHAWTAKHYGLVAVTVLGIIVLISSYFRTDGNEGRAVVAEDIRARRLRKLGTQESGPNTDGDNSLKAQKDVQTKGLTERMQQSREQEAPLKNGLPVGSSSASGESLRQRPPCARAAFVEAMCVPKAAPQVSVPQHDYKEGEEFLDVEEHKQAVELTGKIELSSDEEQKLTAELMGGALENTAVADAGQNVGKRKESATKELPVDSLIKRIVPQLLDCTLEFSEKTSTSPLAKNPPSSVKVILEVQPSEMPTNEQEVDKKMERLLSKRMCAELDPLKFAIQCFDQCTRQPGKLVEKNSKGPQLWEKITSVVKEHCVNTTIKYLIRVPSSPTSVEDDLWADFEPSGQSEATQNYFLSCLGGWSSDGVTVSSELLSILLEKGNQNPDLKDTLVDLVSIAGCRVGSVKRLNEVTLQSGGIFRGLETLFSQPLMVRFLAEALETEVKQSVQEMGVFFQDKSIFSSFLSTTSIEAKVDQKSRASLCFAELPNFPRVRPSEVEPVQAQILDGIHSCQNTVRRALWVILSQKEHKESALMWLSAVVSLNEMRLLSSRPLGSVQQVVASDGFMLNLCTVLLQLCEPFFIGQKGSKFKQIDPGYCTSDACRVSYNNERTVVGGQICKDGDEKSADPFKNLLLPDELKGKHKLTTEMFHITHRALHIGLTSTIQHYKKLLRQYLMLHEMKQGTPLEAETKVLLLLFTLQWGTVMEDDHLIRLCSQFYLTTAVWLQQLLDRCQANSEGLSEKQIHRKQQEMFSKIPEFYIKSMCSWFRYVADHKPSSLRGLDICLFVNCCVTLIQRPDLMPSPVAATGIVSCLLSFIQCTSRRKRKNNLLETNSWGSGVEGDLTASVTMCPAMREKLCPGLIRTYCSVDVVEGLDVDKDEFDKFSARHETIKLLEHLWERPDCRGSFLAECGKPSFQDFLSAILDSLLYLLNDSLSRLTNVRSLQHAKEDGEKWSSLSAEERMEKEQFLKNEEHVSKSFMEMANVTLAFLEKITEETIVAQCFNKSPLSQRSSCAIVGFLDTLCGRKSLDLKVKNMEKYSFNPHDLVLKIVTVLLRISKGACPKQACSKEKKLKEIDECMAVDPDYCKTTMEKALRVLRGQLSSSSEIVRELETLIYKIELLIKMKEEVRLAAMSGSSDASDTASSEQSDGAAAMNGDASDSAANDYVTALEDKKFDAVELVETHAFRCCSQQPVSSRACKVRALMRESTQLRESLPIHPNAAIFVRQDENRMDFARAVVTGPVGTPYSRGCFVFDIYFPASYPSDPPLVKLITTGMGTVRFNPNLYADGKVCLSLLGTWHGGDASEKWDPHKSSLYQVLVSIQGMIFIPDPCFNEPGYEGIRGTSEGDDLSEKYNAGIRLATVRHAMVGVLRQPPVGCEEVIHAHFRMQKELVWKQCTEWLEQCADDEEKRRMRMAVDEVKSELEKL